MLPVRDLRRSSETAVVPVPALTPALECQKAVKIFSQALDEHQEGNFFSTVIDKFFVVSVLSREISISSENACLEIDFFENRFATCFHGQKNELKLSNALAIINDLSEIFSKIASSKEVEKLPLIEDRLSLTHDSDSESSDIIIKIDGVTLLAIYPLGERVVMASTRGTSSMPLQMVQSCGHLFNQRYAKEICPLMEAPPGINHMLTGIRNIYLGRCIIGLVMSTLTKAHSEEAQVRELVRIIVLLKTPHFAFHTKPIL